MESLVDNNRFILILIIGVLSLSVGLVSMSSQFFTAYAQNNILSQDGNGIAKQLTGQLQTSKQEGQSDTGDFNIVSGNNLNCQLQSNNKNLEDNTDLCNN